MANPKKPGSLKLIAGTERADRPTGQVVDLPLVSAAPDPPDWLTDAEAQECFKTMARVLTANGLLTELGVFPLAVHCSLAGEIAKLSRAGVKPTAALVKEYRASGNDFGITPVSQGKVSPSGEPEKPQGFQKNRRPPPKG